MKLIKVILTLLLFITSISANNTLAPMFQKLAKPIKAQEITLKNADDEIIKLSDFKGKTVLLNFWATWCPPCKKEMPSLQRFYQMAKDKGIVVLAIAVGQDDDSVFPFINTVNPTPTFPILFDKDSSVSRFWGISAMPTTIIINKDGYLTHFALGAREFDNKRFLELLLKLK